MNTKTDRDALRALHEVATPGPYYVYQNDLIGGWCAMNCDMPPSRADYRQGQLIVADCFSEADARWYAASHNALPELLDAEEPAEALAYTLDLFATSEAIPEKWRQFAREALEATKQEVRP